MNSASYPMFLTSLTALFKVIFSRHGKTACVALSPTCPFSGSQIRIDTLLRVWQAASAEFLTDSWMKVIELENQIGIEK